MPNELTDDSLMPFGKFGPKQGDQRKMSDVPASYLLWLKDDGCSDPRVRQYIEDNWTALLKECPDRVENL